MMMHVQQLSLDALRVKKQGPKKKPEVSHPAELKGNRWFVNSEVCDNFGKSVPRAAVCSWPSCIMYKKCSLSAHP